MQEWNIRGKILLISVNDQKLIDCTVTSPLCLNQFVLASNSNSILIGHSFNYFFRYFTEISRLEIIKSILLWLYMGFFYGLFQQKSLKIYLSLYELITQEYAKSFISIQSLYTKVSFSPPLQQSHWHPKSNRLAIQGHLAQCNTLAMAMALSYICFTATTPACPQMCLPVSQLNMFKHWPMLIIQKSHLTSL